LTPFLLEKVEKKAKTEVEIQRDCLKDAQPLQTHFPFETKANNPDPMQRHPSTNRPLLKEKEKKEI